MIFYVCRSFNRIKIDHNRFRGVLEAGLCGTCMPQISRDFPTWDCESPWIMAKLEKSPHSLEFLKPVWKVILCVEKKDLEKIVSLIS